MKWFELIKRQRPRKRRYKPVANIFEGEKIRDEERIDQQKKEGRKGTPFKRTGLEGRDIQDRKEKFELQRQRTHHNPRNVSVELGGRSRGGYYGKEEGTSRTQTPKGRCAMCSKAISKNSSWKREDRLLTTGEIGRMRYCYRCMKELGGPKGFVKDESLSGRSTDELSAMQRARQGKE